MFFLFIYFTVAKNHLYLSPWHVMWLPGLRREYYLPCGQDKTGQSRTKRDKAIGISIYYYIYYYIYYILYILLYYLYFYYRYYYHYYHYLLQPNEKLRAFCVVCYIILYIILYVLSSRADMPAELYTCRAHFRRLLRSLTRIACDEIRPSATLVLGIINDAIIYII